MRDEVRTPLEGTTAPRAIPASFTRRVKLVGVQGVLGATPCPQKHHCSLSVRGGLDQAPGSERSGGKGCASMGETPEGLEREASASKEVFCGHQAALNSGEKGNYLEGKNKMHGCVSEYSRRAAKWWARDVRKSLSVIEQDDLRGEAAKPLRGWVSEYEYSRESCERQRARLDKIFGR